MPDSQALRKPSRTKGTHETARCRWREAEPPRDSEDDADRTLKSGLGAHKVRIYIPVDSISRKLTMQEYGKIGGEPKPSRSPGQEWSGLR